MPIYVQAGNLEGQAPEQAWGSALGNLFEEVQAGVFTGTILQAACKSRRRDHRLREIH